MSTQGEDGLLIPTFNYSTHVALPIVTFFWLLFGILGAVIPLFCRKNPNRLTIQVAFVTTAICCYVFWLMAFLSQFNPLVGPQIDFDIAAHMRKVWPISSPPPNAPEECFPAY